MRFLILILLSTFIGCSASPPPSFAPKSFRDDVSKLIKDNRYKDAVQYLKTADPIAQANFDKTGFLAVGEDLIVLPGVYPDFDYHQHRDWMFPGTSDAILDDAWQNAATEFATKYNQQRIAK